MSKIKKLLFILLGAVVAAVGCVMFCHDSYYIIKGETVDLNEILESGAELPRDTYVTYECKYPLVNYAESRDYYDGVIPMPWVYRQYALLTENNMIISAKIVSKDKTKELDRYIRDMDYESPDTPVVLTGVLIINESEMDRYLVESCGDFAESGDVMLTSFVIDTTMTRASAAVLYLFVIAVGMIIIVFSVRKSVK